MTRMQSPKTTNDERVQRGAISSRMLIFRAINDSSAAGSLYLPILNTHFHLDKAWVYIRRATRPVLDQANVVLTLRLDGLDAEPAEEAIRRFPRFPDFEENRLRLRSRPVTREMFSQTRREQAAQFWS